VSIRKKAGEAKNRREAFFSPVHLLITSEPLLLVFISAGFFLSPSLSLFIQNCKKARGYDVTRNKSSHREKEVSGGFKKKGR
jgi:hypothetical protein